MTVVGAWTIFAHPLLLDQLETLTAAVERAEADDPDGYRRTANAKLLAVLRRLMFETVPQDPSRAEYRQGDPLGASRKHWFRAKYGNGRFRLFFRYDSRTRILIYAWVNDAETLRTYGAKTDAYAVFERMLDMGHPPRRLGDVARGGVRRAAESAPEDRSSEIADRRSARAPLPGASRAGAALRPGSVPRRGRRHRR